MEDFFSDGLLLSGQTARKIYDGIKDLPIIDYHCHLDERAIAEDRHFSGLGELWLAGDHYKWRAMRLCGVDEDYITGGRSYREKFLKYAEIMPKLIGNPLYYWTHMELKILFVINAPLNAKSAEEILDTADKKLADMSVGSLLEKFKVEYIATTDDPMKELKYHGVIGGVKVCPTFRPDRCFKEGVSRDVLEKRLAYFISKGCRIADHGFDFVDAGNEDLRWLIEQCHKNGIVLQLHFGTFRNINSGAFSSVGADAGFDVFRASVDTDALAKILDEELQRLGGLPQIVLYPLNDNSLRALAAISGAFPNVLIGAAWWFNDTVCGIRRQMETVSEYAAFGTQLGMLTDSRSFSSYVRFDFYRRLLADFIAEKVDAGEYDENSAASLAADVAYNNVRRLIYG